MLVADSYLGHREDADVADRLDGDHLTVTVDDTERRRSRVRTTAEDGTDLGIVVSRELRDGDVLDADGTPVLVSLAPIDALVVDFAGVEGSTATALTALELGHAAGNRHWDLAVEGERAYLPLAEKRERMDDEIRPHLPDGATVGTDKVSPALFDSGDGGHAHSHVGGHSHDGGHAHSHGDSGHTHGSGGHSHTHGVREIDPEGQS